MSFKIHKTDKIPILIGCSQLIKKTAGLAPAVFIFCENCDINP